MDSFYRSMRARTIYTMLKNQTEYQDLGQGLYKEQACQRVIRNPKRKAKKLGFDLIPCLASTRRLHNLLPPHTLPCF